MWTIDIDIGGSSPSISTFTLTTTGLVDGDFYPTATNLSPANGATRVSADTLISWVDPTGSSTPYMLVVYVESFVPGWIEQGGLLPVTATQWQPPSPLSAGGNDLGVIYFDVDAALASSLSVTSGSITWSASPYAPL